jgi:hypothetical protein
MLPSLASLRMDEEERILPLTVGLLKEEDAILKVTP